MKTAYFSLFCIWGTLSFSQEFKIYENGLIYSPYAMERLKGMVGKKNEEFRTCKLTKKYTSVEQTRGRMFELNNPNIDILRDELMSEITLEQFAKKYRKETEGKLHLLTKNHYKNYKEEKIIGIMEQPDGMRLELLESDWESSNSKCWVWNFSNENYVRVAYLEREFSSQNIPNYYAKMIQYTECLIDTTSQIFNATASKDRWSFGDDNSKVLQNRISKLIDKRFKKKKPSIAIDENTPKEIIRATYDSLRLWEKDKKRFVVKTLSKDQEFMGLFDKAYAEALKNKNSNDDFEYYAAHLLSPGKALSLKRNRIVVGQCSMDDSPRIHAMNIAQLAGESLDWDIFLRAHLNVLNDRMDRVSDGSWAWEDRKTYIKELEKLNIDVPSLIFGIAFRAKNVPDGHYFGSIGRLGRAISESKDISLFQDDLPALISDENLDDYNRLLMFYLYDNMSYYDDTSEEKSGHERNREIAVNLLPTYMQSALSK
ncbi:hypothetical protein [Flagellimonas onchidii]|uniref:hypothetical protein n=1 Tax=Flagellimonas onchidii TaxID=2562684 RepID=UPI0010A63486|nr:hypothetical protein [Allomuricauda onchidii]